MSCGLWCCAGHTMKPFTMFQKVRIWTGFWSWLAFDNHVWQEGFPGRWHSMSTDRCVEMECVGLRVFDSCLVVLNGNWNLINLVLYPAFLYHKHIVRQRELTHSLDPHVQVGRCAILCQGPGVDLGTCSSSVTTAAYLTLDRFQCMLGIMGS